MKRKSLENSQCAIGRSLDRIGDWWTLLIVREALFGARRFSEFQRDLGIAKNTLATRLKTLVADGIFQVQPASDGSAFNEYVLTEKGRGLFPVVIALHQWGETHLFASSCCPVVVDGKEEKPVQRIQVRAHDGRVIQPEELKFISPSAG